MRRNHQSVGRLQVHGGLLKHRVIAVAALAVAGCVLESQAATIRWKTAVDGAFGDVANWNPTIVPGASDLAVFDPIGPAYSVTFSSAPAIATSALEVDNGNVSFIASLAPRVYTVNGSATLLGNSSLSVTGTIQHMQFQVVGTLNVQNGHLTFNQGNDASAGTFNLITGTTSIADAGSTLTVNGGLGIGAAGSLTVAGGTLTAGGDITINGVNAVLQRTSGTFNWAGSLNTMTVQAGGHFTHSADFTTPSSATINVTGPGSLFSIPGVVSTLNINAGGVLNVTNGGDVSAPFIDTGDGSNGNVIVDGAGSTLTTAGSLDSYLGSGTTSGVGNVGTLTFRNGASGTIPAGLNMGRNGGRGSLNVESNATVNLGGSLMGSTSAISTTQATMNINGGTINQAGALTVGTATVSGGTATVNITAAGNFNQGTVTPTLIDASIGSGSLAVLDSGAITINGGSAAFGTLTQMDGTFSFTSGKLGLASSLTVGTGGLLGTNLTLNSNRSLAIGATTTINPLSTLTISGGEFYTNSLVNLGTLTFNTGTLALAVLGVNSGGVLGPNITVGPGQNLLTSDGQIAGGGSVTINGGHFGAVHVDNSGTIVLSSGILTNSGGTNLAPGLIFIGNSQQATMDNAFANAGEITLGGGAARIIGSGIMTNTGVISGGGRIAKQVNNNSGGRIYPSPGETLLFTAANGTNAGLIDLNGGEIDYSASLSNGTTGLITGRGKLRLNSPGSLTNNGQMQFSGGFTDVFGPVQMGAAAAKIIVSGGGTSTFYNNVTVSAGEFRVSAGSRAVFFGNVTGTGFFTGGGVKDFEGGSSALGPVSTPGSTVVEKPAVVSASYFRESALTVSGVATIDSGGGTSHLGALNIAGSSDAWAGILDLKNNSMVIEAGNLGVITNQIKSGLLSGTGIISTAPGAPFRLGSMSNAGPMYTTFQGISGLDGDEVLIRYTRIGDLNLDGTVTISDFIDLASHFNTIGGATWQMGDVNYDGSVTISDFIDLASNFNQSVSGEAVPITGAAENGASAVPEPTCLLLVSAAAVLISRRSRKLPLARLAECGVP